VSVNEKAGSCLSLVIAVPQSATECRPSANRWLH
jgi:hypothetical protein